MFKKPKECSGCYLYENHSTNGFSLPDGTGKNKVLIIGESLGKNELYDAAPFRPYAEAGSVLNTAIVRLGLNRDDFSFWNLIACCPPFNRLEGAKYEEEAINHCKVHFDKVINKYKPKVILALGNLPLKYLAPEVTKFRQLAEETNDKALLKKLTITSLRGYQFDSSYSNIKLISSLHPSYINRMGRIYLGVLMRDLQVAVDIAKGKVPDFNFNYKVIKTREELLDFYNHCLKNENFPIAYDIETPLTLLEQDESEIDFRGVEVRNIDSIQFKTINYDAVFVKWQEPFIDVIKSILALKNPKVGWNNWEFDQVNLEYHLGKDCINGLNIDCMWYFKHLNSDFSKLGRGLQFASNFFTSNLPAWKHLSELEPEKYGTLDVYATLNNYLGIKKQTENKRLFPNTKSIFEGYIDDIVKLKPILDDVSKRGFPIDLQEKERFKKQIEIEIEKAQEELQQIYPEHLRLRKPIEGYKNEPIEIQEIKEAFNKFKNPSIIGNTLFGDCDNYIIHSDAGIISRLIERFTRKKGTTGLIIKDFKIYGRKVKRYCRLDEFKPSSSQQTLAYIKWKKHKVPIVKDKTGSKETTSKEQIYLLYEETGDRFYELLIYIRELKKILSTYIIGWKTDEEGRVHTTFLPLPATGQLSSVRPCIHNSPAHGTRYSSPKFVSLAKQFRKMVAAKPNHSLLSCDWSGFHGKTLAFEAEDEKYFRLVNADIHSFIAAHFLKDEIPEKMKDQWELKGGKLVAKDVKEIEKMEACLDLVKDINLWLTFSDEELIKRLRWIKKNFKFVRDSQAKPAILGIGFGAGIEKIYKLNRYSFKNVSQVKNIFDILRKEFPKIFQFQTNIMNLADKQTYLISRYGYIRRFYDVYDYRLLKGFKSPSLGEQIFKDNNGRYWSKRMGGQAKEAIAFLPSNSAFGKKKEAMRDLWQYEKDKIITNKISEFGMINEIHDDLMFEVEDNKIEEAARIVKEVMERPAIPLKNKTFPEISFSIEVKVGKDWSSMQSLEI